MTSATALFYGRRSRPSRSFTDLGFASSTSSSSSSDSTTSGSGGHHHRKCDSSRRHRHHNPEDNDLFRRPSHVLHPCARSSVAVSEQKERGCIGEYSSRNLINRQTAHGLSSRYRGNDRLPGAVLLAKERLLQRLRGVSVSESRHSGETSASARCNDLWVADTGREISVSIEQPAANTIFTESPQQSAPRERKKRALGLTMETLSQLRHEIFLPHQKGINHSKSKTSIECSICLENFLEGNELVSLHCGHRFHASCLYPWLQTSGKCPYCRSCIIITSNE